MELSFPGIGESPGILVLVSVTQTIKGISQFPEKGPMQDSCGRIASLWFLETDNAVSRQGPQRPFETE